VFEGEDLLNLSKVPSLDLVPFRRRRSVHPVWKHKHLGAKRLATAVLIGDHATHVFLMQYKFYHVHSAKKYILYKIVIGSVMSNIFLRFHLLRVFLIISFTLRERSLVQFE